LWQIRGFFWAGIYLPDDTKLNPDWDMQQTFALDVIVDKKGDEAFVMSTLDHKVWIVTGKGSDFSWYPVPGESSQEIRLNSKGLIPWIPHITKNIHFLLCFENGKDEGRWKGKSYSVKGHGNDFTLILEQADNNKIKVFVEYMKHQEGASSLSASTTQEKEELLPSEESKDYFQAHMDGRERLIQHIAAGATVASVPIGLASLCSIM